MPRNITVTFSDGSSHVYQNAPDNLTPAQVASRAQKEFGKQISALDGGKGAKPVAPSQTARLQSMPKNAAAQRLAQAEQAISQRLRGADQATRDKAFRKFYSDKRIQNLRIAAGMAPVATKEEEIRSLAKSNIEAANQARRKVGLPISPREQAMAAGISNTFGIGPRVASVGNYLGDVLSGREADYGRSFETAKAENRLLREQAPAQAFTGELIGGAFGGGAAGKVVGAVGSRLAAAGAPFAARAGQALQSAVTLKKGQKVRNAAKIIGAGAAGGAAQAAGEGEDILTGAAYGAGGAAALGAGGKALGWLGSKAGEILRLSGVSSILKKYTSTTADDLAERAAKFRKETGTEPTVYELLDLEDRQKLQNVVRRMPGSQRERVAVSARQRVENIPSEMAAVTQKATKRTQQAAARSMASDLAASRGTSTPTAADRKLAKGATENPTRLAQLQREEARNIMAPYDERTAYNSVDDLIPATPTQGSKPGQIVYKIDDPEVAKAIQAAASTLKLRGKDQGITIREVTGIIQELKSDLDGGLIERSLAQRSIDHLEGLLAKDHPDVMPALARMNEQWAGKARQIEGMKELRTQAKVPMGTSKQLLKAENVFETPEGATGRAMKQRMQLTEDLGASTQPALGTVRELAESPALGQQLEQNVGRRAASEITQAARTQSESARKLATVIAEQPSTINDIEAGDLALLASALNPASMAYTKFRAIADISRFVRGIPEGRAKVMVDMLFSQDPKLTQQAINALRTSGSEGQRALREITQAIAAGALSSPSEGSATALAPGETPIEETPEAGPWDDYAQPADEGSDSPYADDLQAIYETEDPALLDLISRVEQQESGGDPNAVSSAGAIGVMQVMPDTAPEAAELAGVPWDEEAYYSDPNYQRLLGIAYLSEMLNRYGGDVEKALAAYNAGPGSLEEAMAADPENWLAYLPEETQDYVRKVA